MEKKPVNIVAIVPYPVFPAKMGGQKGIALFYEYFGKKNKVSLLCTSDTSAPAGFPATIFPMLGTSRLRYINPFLISKISKLIKKEKFTHLIIEHPYFGWLGIILKKLTGIRLIVHSHNMEHLRFRSTGKWWWKLMMRYEKYVHHRANLSFFITKEDWTYASQILRMDFRKTRIITYGTELSHTPPLSERQAARSWLNKQHNIDPSARIFLFNGTLDYKPNLEAVDVIIKEINPILLRNNIHYKIIICGKNLPATYNSLVDYKGQNIVFAGFVDDISLYFKGADTFINPVIEGGGIKTKLVEALGYNLTTVTTASGAKGIPQEVTGGKMRVIEDNNWENFAVIMQNGDNKETPSQFFEYFYWGNIAGKATDAILGLPA